MLPASNLGWCLAELLVSDFGFLTSFYDVVVVQIAMERRFHQAYKRFHLMFLGLPKMMRQCHC